MLRCAVYTSGGKASESPRSLSDSATSCLVLPITWILRDTERLYEPILALVEQSNGALNFHDALIALACQEREIPAIASFDPDFDQVPWLSRLASTEE